ncbi:MAG: Smr domain protein [Burkholderiaceae bacterium]|jgi:DNA-nicking Smr family endonuclease|nr:MAG: Smr domain protein [Burkholderiaceae bacterium]
MTRLHSFKDLGAVRGALADARARDAAEQNAREQAERAVARDRNLFARTVGPVRPVHSAPRAAPKVSRPAPIAAHRARDERAALAQALSDEFDVSTLLDTDEHLSFRRPGIGIDVVRKLRRGQWRIQRDIDLHGLRSDAAREALAAFIRDACRQGLRCVRVVHGKGLGSPGKMPVLKSKVHGWLVQKNQVLAFVQAPPAQGGAGALLVLLGATPRPRCEVKV